MATLNGGIAKIRAAQVNLTQSNVRFNDLLENIVVLQLRINRNLNLSGNFTQSNREFYDNLISSVVDLEQHVGNMKYETKMENDIISYVKVQLKKALGLSDAGTDRDVRDIFLLKLNQTVINSLEACNRYRQRHLFL